MARPAPLPFSEKSARCSEHQAPTLLRVYCQRLDPQAAIQGALPASEFRTLVHSELAGSSSRVATPISGCMTKVQPSPPTMIRRSDWRSAALSSDAAPDQAGNVTVVPSWRIPSPQPRRPSRISTIRRLSAVLSAVRARGPVTHACPPEPGSGVATLSGRATGGGSLTTRREVFDGWLRGRTPSMLIMRANSSMAVPLLSATVAHGFVQWWFLIHCGYRPDCLPSERSSSRRNCLGPTASRCLIGGVPDDPLVDIKDHLPASQLRTLVTVDRSGLLAAGPTTWIGEI